MPLDPPTSNDRGRAIRVWSGLLVFAIVFALGLLVWRWLQVNGAPPLSHVRTANELEAIATSLKTPPGYHVSVYAMGLGAPRVMVLTSKGDIIVSSLPSKVLLIKKDETGIGASARVEVLLAGLHNPSGLFLDGDQLYVAEESRVSRVRFDVEARKLVGDLAPIIPHLPQDGNHITRTIKKGPDGSFYVSIGSTCNVCIEKDPWRAAMIRFRPGEVPQLFASGLRNTVGFDWQPGTNDLYGVDNGRDSLGDELPPEEVNRLVEGGFYGWPYLYGDNQPDPEYGQRGGDRISHASPPVYKLPAHVAPLAILFLRHGPNEKFTDAALVTEHGSWNRSQKIGYQVVALHWRNGEISEEPFLSGFLKNGSVFGRPVDVAEDPKGNIFISDDYNGAIWRLTPSS